MVLGKTYTEKITLIFKGNRKGALNEISLKGAMKNHKKKSNITMNSKEKIDERRIIYNQNKYGTDE